MNTLEAIHTYKIIAIARRVPADKLLPAAEALCKGGIRLLEVTFDQKNEYTIEETSGAIRTLCRHFGQDMHIGAGTVLTAEQAEAAIDAGAEYIISPNFSPAVVAKTLERSAISIPGAFTPTEITAAWDAGAHIIKLFPAGDLGLGFIKSIMAPLSHIPLLATGGVNEQNLRVFLAGGMVGAGIGSHIVNNELIAAGKFGELTGLAQKFTRQIGEMKQWAESYASAK